MCGIVGYIGKNNDVKRGIDMLKRLEYRGYDCLSPDSLIQLADGRIKSIRELELNSLLSSINLQTLSRDIGKVEFKAKKIKDKFYQIRTSNFEIKCSAEHKFFVYQDGKILEKRASKLKKGEFLLSQRKISIKDKPQKLPQIKNIIYYQLTSEGVREIQKIREKFGFSYIFLRNKTKVLYVDDHLRGIRGTTLKNWQKVLALFGIDAKDFVEKYSKKKICAHSFRNIFRGTYLTPELSQIIGYIMGDGSRLESKRDDKIKIEDDKETLEKYQKIFHKIGLGVKLLKHRHKNCWQIRVYSASFSKLLNKIALGILDGSSKREVPEIIQKSSLSCVADFLRGIYDAEGSVGRRKRDGINLNLSNEKLLKQIQLLLLRFGIISSLSFTYGKLDRLSIYQYDSLKKFSSHINFSSPRKKGKLQKLIDLKKEEQHKYPPILNSLVFLTKIKEIKISSSKHLMYDISVSKTQNFIANGLLTHNSAGLAVYLLEKKEIFYLKKVGKVQTLEDEFLKSPVYGNPFILHTRWATTGAVSEANSHPHFDCAKNIFLVHNGIIENYQEIKSQLIKEGHKFHSECDSEVLCHLIEKYFQGNLEEAVRKALREVRGTYGIAVISKKDPQKIVAARFSSPLILGINQDEFLVASDPAALITHTRQIINLDDNEIAVLKPDDFFILKEKPLETIEWKVEEAQKQGYPHFMLKEIMEGPETIENAIRGRLMFEEGSVKFGGLDSVSDKLRKIDKLILVGCGTAHYAALVGEYMLEEYAGIPCKVDIGSEFRYRKPVVDEKTAAIFVSQSGETADTLSCLREMKKKGILTTGITNVVGSSQSRETNAGVYIRSGPEIAVASTKAFLGQLTTLAMLTVYLGRQREMALVMGKRIVSELAKIPDLAREILKLAPEIEKLAQKYKDFKNFFFIGRKYNFPIALEGALKLKEISYLHAEGIGGGELKHGPLALIDENFPTIAICPSDSVYEKMVSNIEEIKARKGPLIAIATEGNEDIKKIVDDVIYIPKTLEMLTPILSVIPLHLFAYYVAVLFGKDPDFPRNLAKAVSVE